MMITAHPTSAFFCRTLTNVRLLMVLRSSTSAPRSMPDPGPVDIIHTNYQATLRHQRHIPGMGRKSSRTLRPGIEWEHQVPNLLGAVNGSMLQCHGAGPGMFHSAKNGVLECGRLSSSAAAVAGIHDHGAGKSTENSPQWGRRRGELS